MHRPNSQRSYSCSAITNSSNRRYAASLRRNKDPCFSTIFVMWFLLCHCQAESSFELGLLRAWISLRWIRITRASLMILAKALIEPLTEHPTLRAKDRQIPALFSADIAIVAVIRSWRRNSCELCAKARTLEPYRGRARRNPSRRGGRGQLGEPLNQGSRPSRRIKFLAGIIKRAHPTRP